MKRRQYFRAKFRIDYPSGKSFTTEEEYLCYSELGVIDTIRWIFKGKNISILSIIPTGKFAGTEIFPNNHVIGDL